MRVNMVTSARAATARTLNATDDVRHFLRRLTFAATPPAERALQGRSVAEAADVLIREARAAAVPAVPESARGLWTNEAIRFRDSDGQQYWVGRTKQYEQHLRDIEGLRHWWLAEMIA